MIIIKVIISRSNISSLKMEDIITIIRLETACLVSVNTAIVFY